MKQLVLTIILSVTVFSFSFAQDSSYPKGAYMSFEEIVSRSPSVQIDLGVLKRTKGDIKMVGGNDYKLTSEDKAVKSKFLKKEIWAYSLGDTLYLNCFRYEVQPWYAAVISDGDYLVFRGGLSQNSEEQERQMQMGYSFGAIGGALAGAKLALLRFLYAVDKNTHQIITVTPESLRGLLQKNNELLNRFEEEPNKESEEVLLKYLQLLNGQ